MATKKKTTKKAPKKKAPAKRNGRPPGRLSDETIERMNAVETMLLSHYTDYQVIQIGSKQWGVAEKTVKKYVKEVRARWLEEAEEQRPARKVAAVNRLKKIARDTPKHDTRALVKVEMAIADIEGTRAAEKREVAVTADVSSSINAIAQVLGVDPEELE